MIKGRYDIILIKQLALLMYRERRRFKLKSKQNTVTL